jgi:DNA-binding NarL/FixJ family response regulator
VLLSSYTDARIVLACARAGVRGFVSTANATKDLGRAILAVHQGGTYVGGREIPPC